MSEPDRLPYKLYKRVIALSKKAGIFVPKSHIAEVGHSIKRMSTADAIEYLSQISEEMGWGDDEISDAVREKLYQKGVYAGKMFGTLCEVAKKGVNIDFMLHDLEHAPENVERKLKEDKYKSLLGWDEISPSLLKYLDSLDKDELDEFARQVLSQQEGDDDLVEESQAPSEAEAGKRSKVPFTLTILPHNHAAARKIARVNRRQGKSSSLVEDEEED